MSYHPANLALVDYPAEAVIALAEKAAELGVLIHIDGIPFGASSRPRAYSGPVSNERAA